MTKIYDCFSYWDEDLLLDIRFNILNDYVDYFVIIEGNKTWQNNSKEFKFTAKKEHRQPSEEEILYSSFEQLLHEDEDNI